MSSVYSGRKSIGNRSNKSGSSKRGPKVSSRFWKPTISSSLKKREFGAWKENEENENLTETTPKADKLKKGKSPRPIKFLYKSPMKSASRLSNKFPSPATKPRVPKAPRRTPKNTQKTVKPQKSPRPQKFQKSHKIPKLPKSPASKPDKENIASPLPPPNNLLTVTEEKPLEGLDFKFEIPETLVKKRDKKAAEKTEESKQIQDLADITNCNLDAISSSTPMRCVTGKSSVVRSSISLLQSDPGSGKSTPNITPYKVMRKNKENGKDGTQNIEDLTNKIKRLEQDIFKSKNLPLEEEYSENNEFLEGISEIDGDELLKKTLKDQGLDIQKGEDVEEQIVLQEPSPEKVEPTLPEPTDQTQLEDISEIKELEAMIGKVFNTIKKDDKLSSNLQSKIKAYENLTSDLLKTVNEGEDQKEQELQTSSRSAKGNIIIIL